MTIDPSFGAGFGYVLAGTPGTELNAMAMDRNGNVILAGARPAGPGAEVPVVMRLLPDGTPDPAFGVAGVVDGNALGLVGGRATGLLLRSDGTITYTVGSGPRATYPATFTTIRLLPTGAPDPSFSSGVVSIPLGVGQAAGIGASSLVAGPNGSTLVAGTDLTATNTPRGGIIRLRANGTLDTRSAPAASRASLAPAARSGSRRWPATAPAASWWPGPVCRPTR